MNSLRMEIIQALSGDSIFLTYIGSNSKKYHILVDGGMPKTFKKIIQVFDNNEIETINYVFLTHIDQDHIGGILKLLNSSFSSKIKNVFFNSGHMINQKNSSFISQSDGISLIEQINQSSFLKSNSLCTLILR